MNNIVSQNVFHKINQYTKPSMSIIVKIVIESLDGVKMTGAEKKMFAIQLIKDYTIAIPSGDFKTAILNAIETDIIGDMIDLIISASKNKLNINKKTIIQIIIKSLKCCFKID